jgi:cytochrome c oxidase subunit 2
MDAIPGTVNRMVFEAKDTGQFEIGCAQHCGANHYKMRGILTVLPRDEYEAWVAQASKDSQQVFDANDSEAQWGWDWKKI